MKELGIVLLVVFLFLVQVMMTSRMEDNGAKIKVNYSTMGQTQQPQ